MIKPFRKYKTIVDWTDNNKTTQSCETVINLFNVNEWSSCDNEYFDFNDNIKRSCCTFHDGTMYKMRVPFNEFDTLMTNFLEEVKLLDERSMYKPKPRKSHESIQTKFGIVTYFN